MFAPSLSAAPQGRRRRGTIGFIYGFSGLFTPFRAETCRGREIAAEPAGKRGRAAEKRDKTGKTLAVKARLRKTVVLVGMMGAGKTAVGNALARALSLPFLDSDEEIVRAANRSVAEIFARDGESFFREKEAQVIRRLLAGRPCVLSTGGGAFLSEVNRQAIAEKGVSVWLKADLDLLWQRVRHKPTRPLLRTPDPKGTLAALLEARAPVYALADLTVEARPEFSIDDMTTRVIDALAAHPGLLDKG